MLLRSQNPIGVLPLLLLFAAVAIHGEGILRVDTDTHQIVDESGRQRYFRGVNVVYKGDPWYPSLGEFDPQFSFNEQDMDDIKSWGFNAVRLGFMWPGAEPQRGVFNETYMSIMHNITSMLAKRGIYTLIDFHQDCLAASFCGEGIPEWAVVVKDSALAFPEPLGRPFNHEKKPSVPSDADCAKHNWPGYQATSAASSAYQSLYEAGWVRDAFVSFWQRIAADYVSNPYIMGYELINEPFPGDIYTHPSLLIPGVADRTLFAPFYEAVSAGIRQVDPAHLIFFEPLTFDDVTMGIESVPGGASQKNHSVLAFHFYHPPNLSPQEAFSHHQKEIGRLGGAGFLTEFNMCNRKEHLLEVLDTADAHLISWLGWEYKSFFPITGVCEPFYNTSHLSANSSPSDRNAVPLNTERVRILSRTYAPAVAGRVLKMEFNEETSVFSLSYQIASSVHLPTEIYYNAKMRYANGVNIVLEPAEMASAAVTDVNHITITHSAQAQEGALLTVTISPV